MAAGFGRCIKGRVQAEPAAAGFERRPIGGRVMAGADGRGREARVLNGSDGHDDYDTGPSPAPSEGADGEPGTAGAGLRYRTIPDHREE